MLKQYKYAFRESLTPRMTVLGITILLNAGFLLVNTLGPGRAALKVLAVVLASMALAAVVTVGLIYDIKTFRGIFRAPHGYLTVLTPVHRGRVLASRIVSILAMDAVALTIAIIGVVLNSMAFTETLHMRSSGESQLAIILWAILTGLLAFLYLLTAIAFWTVLSNTVFYRFRLRGLLGLLVMLAAMYLLHFSTLLLVPLGGRLESWKMLYAVVMYFGLNLPTIAYPLLFAGKSAVLFFISARLAERRMNL